MLMRLHEVHLFAGPATTETRSTPRWTTWPTTRWTRCWSPCQRRPTPPSDPHPRNFIFQTTSITCHPPAALQGGLRLPHRPRPHPQVFPLGHLEVQVVTPAPCYRTPRPWVFITRSRQTFTILPRPCTDLRRFTFRHTLTRRTACWRITLMMMMMIIIILQILVC